MRRVWDERVGYHLVATKDYRYGETILVEKPIVLGIDWNTHCVGCNGRLPNRDAEECGVCVGRFCSPECAFENDEGNHQFECTFWSGGGPESVLHDEHCPVVTEECLLVRCLGLNPGTSCGSDCDASSCGGHGQGKEMEKKPEKKPRGTYKNGKLIHPPKNKDGKNKGNNDQNNDNNATDTANARAAGQAASAAANPAAAASPNYCPNIERLEWKYRGNERRIQNLPHRSPLEEFIAMEAHTEDLGRLLSEDRKQYLRTFVVERLMQHPRLYRDVLDNYSDLIEDRETGSIQDHLLSIVIQVWARLQVNHFTIGGSDQSCSDIGSGVFPAGAILEHSCYPNCDRVYDVYQEGNDNGNRESYAMRIFALCNIKKGERLTHGYHPPTWPTALRWSELRSGKNIDRCACDKCRGLLASLEPIPAEESIPTEGPMPTVNEPKSQELEAVLSEIEIIRAKIETLRTEIGPTANEITDDVSSGVTQSVVTDVCIPAVGDATNPIPGDPIQDPIQDPMVIPANPIQEVPEEMPFDPISDFLSKVPVAKVRNVYDKLNHIKAIGGGKFDEFRQLRHNICNNIENFGPTQLSSQNDQMKNTINVEEVHEMVQVVCKDNLVALASVVDTYFGSLMSLYCLRVTNEPGGKIEVQEDLPCAVREYEATMITIAALTSMIICEGEDDRKKNGWKKSKERLVWTKSIYKNILQQNIGNPKGAARTPRNGPDGMRCNVRAWQQTLEELQLHFTTIFVTLLFSSYSQWVDQEVFRALADGGSTDDVEVDGDSADDDGADDDGSSPRSPSGTSNGAKKLKQFEDYALTMAHLLGHMTTFCLDLAKSTVPRNHLSIGHILAIRGNVRSLVIESDSKRFTGENASQKKAQLKKQMIDDLRSAKEIYTTYRYPTHQIDDLLEEE